MSAPRRRARRVLGYTLVEVMVGIAVSAIGIVGVTFMQGASVRSNQDAYEGMVATSFARTWIERVKRDAANWWEPGAPPVATMFAGRPTPPNTYFQPGLAWTVARPLDAFESSGANYRGVDVGATDLANGAGVVVTNADIYYCANHLFTTVQSTTAGAPTAMRVDVRVWWNRKASLEDTNYTQGIVVARNSPAGCADPGAMLGQVQLQLPAFRVIYLTTVVRWVPP